jgi:hypothetical protein
LVTANDRICHGFLDYQSSIKRAVFEPFITSAPINAIKHMYYKNSIITHHRCMVHNRADFVFKKVIADDLTVI